MFEIDKNDIHINEKSKGAFDSKLQGIGDCNAAIQAIIERMEPNRPDLGEELCDIFTGIYSRPMDFALFERCAWLLHSNASIDEYAVMRIIRGAQECGGIFTDARYEYEIAEEPYDSPSDAARKETIAGIAGIGIKMSRIQRQMILRNEEARKELGLLHTPEGDDRVDNL